MEYGINLNSIAPLRAEPDDRSEMISQLLLGERYVCGERQNNFCKIYNEADQYSGWIDEKTITSITQQENDQLSEQLTYYVVIPLVEAFDLTAKSVIRIPGGSRLPNCDSIGHFSLRERKFQVHRDFILPESEIVRDGLMMTAEAFINAPYMWGGKTIMGMDCSGFVQIIFGLHGIKLPRDSKEQAFIGTSVDFAEAKPGDLFFFRNKTGQVIHVGIYMKNQRIIHASGRVKIERIDERGIYSDEYQKYTHSLHSIRRVCNKKTV